MPVYGWKPAMFDEPEGKSPWILRLQAPADISGSSFVDFRCFKRCQWGGAWLKYVEVNISFFDGVDLQEDVENQCFPRKNIFIYGGFKHL